MNNNTTDNMVYKTIPFLGNFPFPEFTMSAGTVIDTLAPNRKINTISFDCTQGINTCISMFEKEVWFLNSISHNINKLNDIKKIIDNSLSTNDILIKRDAIIACEQWSLDFSNEKGSNFNQETFNRILERMIEYNKIVDPVTLLDSIDKLHKRKGLIKLEDDHEKVISNYYQFQLIYYKLILGIVIASKISI